MANTPLSITLTTSPTQLATEGCYCNKDIKILAPLQTTSTTAGTSSKTITTSSSYYGISKITVYPTPATTKTATANGTVTPDSGKYLSSVTVNVPPKPVDVATAAAMDALLVAANVGNAYRYTGTTTSNYVSGDIYIVE